MSGHHTTDYTLGFQVQVLRCGELGRWYRRVSQRIFMDSHRRSKQCVVLEGTRECYFWRLIQRTVTSERRKIWKNWREQWAHTSSSTSTSADPLHLCWIYRAVDLIYLPEVLYWLWKFLLRSCGGAQSRVSTANQNPLKVSRSSQEGRLLWVHLKQTTCCTPGVLDLKAFYWIITSAYECSVLVRNLQRQSDMLRFSQFYAKEECERF